VISPRPRRRARPIVLLVLLGLTLDWTRPPERQLSAFALLAAIHGYQATLSKLMPGLGVRCRFKPSCSHYAEGAVAGYGALGGSLLAVWRVLRCGPWTPAGTVDLP
jgi:putative membrane protein insertion efficiency factor